MIKPDIIVCWPRNNDYPIWREFIHNNRSRFNEIIIVFTETNYGDDYRDFVRSAMFNDAVQFVDILNIPSGQDWRDVSVNAALMHSYNAEYIWFTEQDFFPKEGFWDFIEKAFAEGNDIVATYDATRMHPCNIMITRYALTWQTRKDFGIVPDKIDHFGVFQRAAESMGAKIAKVPENLYEHLNGLSHNFSLIERGELPNYHAERFNQYLRDCLSVGVPLCDRWVLLVGDYLKKIA